MKLKVDLAKDYDPEDFSYNKITKAWQVVNGLHPNVKELYFFIAHLINIPYAGGGHWMAFTRRLRSKYEDIPFDNNRGFEEEGEAEEAIFKRAYNDLGYRVSEIEIKNLPINKQI